MHRGKRRLRAARGSHAARLGLESGRHACHVVLACQAPGSARPCVCALTSLHPPPRPGCKRQVPGPEGTQGPSESPHNFSSCYTPTPSSLKGKKQERKTRCLVSCGSKIFLLSSTQVRSLRPSRGREDSRSGDRRLCPHLCVRPQGVQPRRRPRAHTPAPGRQAEHMSPAGPSAPQKACARQESSSPCGVSARGTFWLDCISWQLRVCPRGHQANGHLCKVPFPPYWGRESDRPCHVVLAGGSDDLQRTEHLLRSNSAQAPGRVLGPIPSLRPQSHPGIGCVILRRREASELPKVPLPWVAPLGHEAGAAGCWSSLLPAAPRDTRPSPGRSAEGHKT